MQKAYLLSDEPSAGDIELQRLHCKCGNDLVEVARLTLGDKGKLVDLAREVESKCAALSDDQAHGWSLVLLGAVLHAAQQWQEALEHLNRARIMLKAAKNISYLAAAYQAIARVHYRERRLPEALDGIQEACKHISNPPLQAMIYMDSGVIHFSANRDTEAWNYTELALMNASHVGNRLYIARALESMGYGYLRRGDYENAYGAYEAAAEKYRGTVETYVETRCKDNMARIKWKQRNPDAQVGFYRHSMDVDKSLF
jgi:tetratricopeptide (TPR) repeat protein